MPLVYRSDRCQPSRRTGACHTPACSALRVLAPLDGSSRATAPPRPCGPDSAMAPRRLAALFHAARVPVELPSRAFPSRGAVPALAGPCFLAGSLSDLRQRGNDRGFHDRFPCRASPLPCSPPEGEPRLMDRDDSSSRPLGRPREGPPASTTPGSLGEWPARPLRSLAPPGSPFALRSHPGQG